MWSSSFPLEPSFYSKLDAAATTMNLWDLLKSTVACIRFFQANRKTDRICSLQFRLVLGPRAHLQDQSQTCHKSCNSKCATSKHLDFKHLLKVPKQATLVGTGPEGLKKIQCEVMMWDLYVWSYVCFWGGLCWYHAWFLVHLIYELQWLGISSVQTWVMRSVAERASSNLGGSLRDHPARAGTGRMHISTGTINRKWQDLCREKDLYTYTDTSISYWIYRSEASLILYSVISKSMHK